MVKYETFNLCYMGSNPIGLKIIMNYIFFIMRLSINGRSTVFQTDDVGSIPTNRSVFKFIVLKHKLIIGKGFHW